MVEEKKDCSAADRVQLFLLFFSPSPRQRSPGAMIMTWGSRIPESKSETCALQYLRGVFFLS